MIKVLPDKRPNGLRQRTCGLCLGAKKLEARKMLVNRADFPRQMHALLATVLFFRKPI
jgi:hypothetical protein